MMEHMKPRRLRITEPGLIGYNGQIRGHDFVDGVSVHPVSYLEAYHIGSVMRVEDADTAGQRVSPVETLRRLRDLPADNPDVQKVGSSAVEPEELPVYTREELEAIGDSKGLPGLRDVAAKYGVGARSINDIIKRILEAQPKRAPEPSPEVEAEPAPVETPESSETEE